MKKKFIELAETEKITLQAGHKNGKAQAFQARCHCLVLSSEGYQVKELARIFRVSEISIYSWFKRWEESGIVGLRDKAGRGRKPILRAEDLAQIKRRVQENAQGLKIARSLLKEELGREFSTKTLKRFLKSLIADTNAGGNVWKRSQCPIEQESKKEALAELLALAAVGLIELYFGDESGFWQNPVIAGAWQFAGEEIRLFPEKGKRLSVFGLLNFDCQGRFWTSEKTIKSEFVIDCLEQWMAEKSDKPRVLVLDNARIHRSKLMQERLAGWEEKGFYIFNLPTYSPHLNIIEILWRRMKYEWLRPADYASFEKLTEAIQGILSHLGTEYKINFKDRKFIK